MCAAADLNKYYDYDINYNKPGLVVIINNNSFDRNKFPERKGSEKDVGRIRQVFTKLNFSIKSHCDLRADELVECINEYAHRDYSNDSCFLIFIMSHGSKGKIKSSDNQDIFISECIDPFLENKSLKQKPKIFIIQACRSIIENTNANPNANSINNMVSDSDAVETPVRIPIGDDFLLCNSTIQGHEAWRDTEKGSLYIQHLCDVISESPYLEICQILTRVNSYLTRTWKLRAVFESQLAGSFYFTKE